MAQDVFPILVQSEQSNLPVMCTQMIGITNFVSRPWKSHSPAYSNEIPEVRGWLD